MSYLNTYYTINSFDIKITTNNLATKKKSSTLENYGTDLTYLATQGKLEECFGREEELLELMEILIRRQKNNPVLIGEAGVGKTAIIELFANRLAKNLVPFVLEGRTLISIDLSRLVAGSKYRGDFELRFQKLIKEILNKPNIIIFIDEIHIITGTGSVEGSMDVANLLKPILSRSGFQCIGATTVKEYENIEKDPALNRRFQSILVKEPTVEDTIKILYSLRSTIESFHNIEILPDALHSAAELSSRYIHEKFLPDKAIDLLDRAAAKEVLKLTSNNHGSIVRSVINATLLQINHFKIEAFRSGDIASEFIFQEIQNAYKNFFLRWLESPSTIPEYSVSVLSPISKEYFDNIKLSILKHVDKLLFASNKPNYILKTYSKFKNLSFSQNQIILNDFKNTLFNNKKILLNIYRISLFLLFNWLNKTNTKNKKIYSLFNYYLGNIKTKRLKKVIFYVKDCEKYIRKLETLNEIEKIEFNILHDSIKNLKPLLRKSLLETLKNNLAIKLSSSDLSLIYTLLGHSGKNSTNNLLLNQNLNYIDSFKNSNKLKFVKQQLTEKHIHDLISHITGIPISTLSNSEIQKLTNLESILHNRVIGQEEAISAIAKAIRRSRLGIQNPDRPLASFLFCGPTGVGKTELTKALALTLFGSEKDMIRFDMSEFMEKFTISRLIGAPPGYIGYEDSGELTEAVRKKPYSIVLFDEIEKAHPDILNILLQILEDGRLTDNKKRIIPFDNTMIILTSNAAAEEIQQIIKENNKNINFNKTTDNLNVSYYDNYSGVIDFLKAPIQENFLEDIKNQLKTEFKKSFKNLKESTTLQKDFQINSINSGLTKETDDKLKTAVLNRLNTLFLPEFLNRLDDIIIFKPLTLEELYKICDIMINDLILRLKTKQIFLNVNNNVKFKICKEGYNPMFGARPIRRLITKYIEDLITDEFLKNPTIKKEKIINIILNEENNIVLKNSL